jgi:hypothetical protein
MHIFTEIDRGSDLKKLEGMRLESGTDSRIWRTDREITSQLERSMGKNLKCSSKCSTSNIGTTFVRSVRAYFKQWREGCHMMMTSTSPIRSGLAGRFSSASTKLIPNLALRRGISRAKFQNNTLDYVKKCSNIWASSMANAANARANAMRIQADLAMTQVSECPSLKGKALTKTSAKHWSDHPEIGEHDHKARLNRA